MYPTLHEGDLLVVQGVSDPCEIHASPMDGDIIVFHDPTDPSRFVVHRAIRKERRANMCYFITKGDNNLSSDPWQVPGSLVVGRVVARIPLLGYLKIYFGTQFGITLLVLIIIVLIVLDLLPALKQKAKPGSKPRT